MRARAILNGIQLGKLSGGTSSITFDELVWAVRQVKGEDESVLAGELFLNTPHLVILEVGHEILKASLDIIRKHHLRPRDSIHAASALNASAECLVSEDRDYDALASLIPRKSIADVSLPK
jgi:predicted nucleic acid-binding protein